MSTRRPVDQKRTWASWKSRYYDSDFSLRSKCIKVAILFFSPKNIEVNWCTQSLWFTHCVKIILILTLLDEKWCHYFSVSITFQSAISRSVVDQFSWSARLLHKNSILQVCGQFYYFRSLVLWQFRLRQKIASSPLFETKETFVLHDVLFHAPKFA